MGVRGFVFHVEHLGSIALMVEIQLANGRGVALVDDEDAWLVTPFSWCLLVSGSLRKNYYAMARIAGRCILMHRWIANPPDGMEVDHRDRNGLHNWRANLRVCTHAENRLNTGAKTGSRTGLKGVSVTRSGRFLAQATFQGKTVGLGRYDTAEEAHAAYVAYVRELHGEFFRAA